jgi:hypothetical protein
MTATRQPASTARLSSLCMSVASGVVRSALKRSRPILYSTVPVMAAGSPAASGMEAIR